MSGRKLTKGADRLLFGVCSGIAEYFGWDTTWVRIVYALVTVFTAFSGALVYVILAIVMPKK